jgi:dihydrofolate reductase
MRKIIVISHLSLDGVIQAMGGRDEDTSGGFAYGGWVMPYADPVLSSAIRTEMNMSFDLLLGRKTFDIWAPYWPQHDDIWHGANIATKYVASTTLTAHEWQPSVFLNGDIAEKLHKIKQEDGRDLHVYGSGNLLQTLFKHDLVDALWLKIYPLILGGGKRLFGDGNLPTAFSLIDSQTSPSGVIMANYERRGAVMVSD